MSTVSLHNSQYTNYYGYQFFNILGIKDIKFTPRIVNSNGAKVVLVHISGMNPLDGSEVDTDFWPRYNCTLDDIAALPAEFADIKFRIGTHTTEEMKEVADPETGEISRKKVTVVKTGTPKMIAWMDIDKVWHRFSGSRVEFDETLGKSVYSNEPATAAEAAEKDAEDKDENKAE